MKVKTQDLTGPTLDWAVAQVIHAGLRYKYGEPVFDPKTKRIYQTEGLRQIGVNFMPSTNWAQGGPIIEQEGITVCHGSPVHGLEWMACDRSSTHIQHGPSYLIAAMRCFCASKLGEEIEIPKELK